MEADLQTDMQIVWSAWARGELSDDQAQSAAEAAHRGVPRAADTFKTARAAFPARRVQRSPDRQRSIERRRRLAASGPMPPALAACFTVSEQAVMRIVADEIRVHGCCYRHIDSIAARAGVGRSTVKNAVRQARRLGLLHVQERRRAGGLKSLTNIVKIVSREWLLWINRGPKATVKKITPTDTRFSFQWKSRTTGRAEAPERGLTRQAIAKTRPPDP
jgi:hypothetical protein